jgi:carbamoyl-phosphate synthase large subunit
MSSLNVLILSAGRRVELVQCFQEAARRLRVYSKIVAGDCSTTAPALYFADGFYQLPRINEPNYIEAIIKACLDEDIALVVPTIDTDLLILAENKDYIEERTGAKVLISDLEAVKICRDKIETQAFFERHDFGVPRMYTADELASGNITFPVFMKPKSGSSSINTYKVHNQQELQNFLTIVEQPIVQDFIEGEEYTVDVFLDFESNIVSIVPRLRIATRSGEIAKGKVVKDKEIMDNVRKLMNVLKPIGHITVQLMKTGQGIQYIEINPRFGGGAPMSIQSGADSCEFLFRLLLGETLTYTEDYRDNLTFLRFDQSICLDEHGNIVNLESNHD